MKYEISLNQGNEVLGSGKTITANEVVETVDEKALAREIHHLNALIPEQVAESVLANFCQAAAQLMAMGYAVTLKNGNDVALRIYPDIHIKGGNINLARAKELDPTVTELTEDNAGELIDKAGGVQVRVRATCMQKFTDLLEAEEYQVKRVGIETKAYVAKTGSSEGSEGGNGGGIDTSGDMEG